MQLVFDMDGTIANLYGVPNWLEQLRQHNPTPFEIAEPMYDMQELVTLLIEAKNSLGVRVVINSWKPMESSPEYDRLVRQAKVGWLERFDFPYDEIHIIKYGTPKHSVLRHRDVPTILYDDNAEVRKVFERQPYCSTVAVEKISIIEHLKQLLKDSV